jgi:hypothetical protein
MTDDFIAYRGGPRIHDGSIVSVEHLGDQLLVVVESDGGDGRISLDFGGVTTLIQHRAVGMTLYALAEMQAPEPFRRFVFVNWDEENDDARLELVCRTFADPTVSAQ